LGLVNDFGDLLKSFIATGAGADRLGQRAQDFIFIDKKRVGNLFLDFLLLFLKFKNSS
jgi:hypothetical protein